MSYFADIMAHIIMIIEAGFLENDLLFNKIRDLFVDLILGFERVQLDNLKAIPEEYYKRPHICHEQNSHFRRQNARPVQGGRDAQKPLDKIARVVFEKTKKYKELVKILLHIQKHSSPEKAKQVHDCYVNISMYANICPDLLLEHFDEFFGNGIFRTPRSAGRPTTS